MNAVEVFISWLDDYLNFEKRPQKNIFWLDTIDFLCKRFDNPQDFAPNFHVAGSKGKGSVSRMIASILQEAGYKTGVYSSPHILDFRERITFPDSFLPEEIYEQTVKQLVPKIESIIPEELPAQRPLTWFELVTLYAFLCFKNAQVDWAVYEVGLGGRLDATNILRPKLCCITPIELEHSEFLGDTIEKVAAEKAGIIKKCTPVIVAKQQSESVKNVFKEKAKENYAPCYFIDELVNKIDYSFDSNSKSMSILLESPIFDRQIKTNLSLLGSKHAENAAMAAVAIKKLFPNMDESVIEKGLSKAKLPGRFEICDSVIFDGAHTYNSIKLTLETLDALYPEKTVNLLFACAADKDIKDISLLFKNKFHKIYLTIPGSQKQSDLHAGIEAFKNAKLDFTSDIDYKKIIKQALEETKQKDEILLITGSFYLVSEAKKIMKDMENS